MKTALITGANRGIGLAIARGLAEQHNMRVLLGSRALADGAKAAETINGATHPVEVDLTERKQLLEQLRAIHDQYGAVEVLVNNAAIYVKGNFLELDIEKVEHSIRVNTMAALDTMRFWLPLMSKNNYGRIVNLSSQCGSFAGGLGCDSSYSFSKAALNALTFIAGRDAPAGIKINAMCPGWVKTGMGGDGAPRTPQEGADTALWLATLPDDGPSGGFFRDRKPFDW